MSQLHNPFISQTVVTWRVNLRFGDCSRIIVDLKCVLEQRLETIPLNGIQSLLQ